MRTLLLNVLMAAAASLTCTTHALAASMSAQTFASYAAQLQGQQSVSAVQTSGGATMELLLTPFNVFTADARVELVDGSGRVQVLPVPQVQYFKGEISGEPFSRVFVSVQEDGSIRGLADRDGVMWTLGAEARATGAVRLDSVDMNRERPDGPFTCGEHELTNATLGDVVAATPKSGTSAPVPNGALYRARIAIETDYEFYQRFSSSSAATAYVGDVIGYASTVYVAQIDTQLEVSFVRLWSSAADPWAQSGSSCALAEFGQHWNNNMSGTNRSLAHMLSGKSTGGGVAWTGVLCSGAFNSAVSGCPITGNIGGAYGLTGSITGGFNAGNPSIVWDVVATAHEIGHNFNSPHTHCYAGIGGDANPVDECYSGESGCFSGTTKLPGPASEHSGTLMSYCHLKTGGTNNIAYTFGKNHAYGSNPQRVPDRMKAHVASRAAAYPSCLAIEAQPAPGQLFESGFD